MTLWTKAIDKHQTMLPVKIPFTNLAKEINVDRGDLVTVLGSPAAGKSVFTLNWLAALDEPSVLINLDTPTLQQANRLASIHSHRPYEWVKDNEVWTRQYLSHNVSTVRGYDVPLRDTKILRSIVNAETEYWGETPAVMVIDNIRNITSDHTYEAFSSAFLGLHHVAMESGICVVVLHHVNRSSGDMTKPLTVYSGQFSGEQDSSVVLGLWRPQSAPDAPTNQLNVSILKQREGNFDPSGNFYVKLQYDRATYRLV